MKPYEYLPHTADVKVRATGEDFADAARNAALAVAGLLVEGKVQAVEDHSFAVSASSLESLLLDFLDELIYLKDTKHFVAADAQLQFFDHGDSWALEGTLLGDAISKYESHGDVKAATYHSLSVKESDDGVVFEFVLDI